GGTPASVPPSEMDALNRAMGGLMGRPRPGFRDTRYNSLVDRLQTLQAERHEKQRRRERKRDHKEQRRLHRELHMMEQEMIHIRAEIEELRAEMEAGGTAPPPLPMGAYDDVPVRAVGLEDALKIQKYDEMEMEAARERDIQAALDQAELARYRGELPMGGPMDPGMPPPEGQMGMLGDPGMEGMPRTPMERDQMVQRIRDEMELEQLREEKEQQLRAMEVQRLLDERELEQFKLERQRQEDELRMRERLELERLQTEAAARERDDELARVRAEAMEFTQREQYRLEAKRARRREREERLYEGRVRDAFANRGWDEHHIQGFLADPRGYDPRGALPAAGMLPPAGPASMSPPSSPEDIYVKVRQGYR
ncbi:hypothetical protein KEM55_002189, partial [Ascosphaera atra]